MRLLKLFILPLIISSLIAGSSNLNNKMSSKITIRTLSYFAITSLATATIGLFLCLIIQPGKSSAELAPPPSTIDEARTNSILDSFMDLGRWVKRDANSNPSLHKLIVPSHPQKCLC